MRLEASRLSFRERFWQKARMLVLRSLAFNAAFYLLLIAMLIVGLPLLFGTAQSVRNWARLWARSSLWLLEKVCGVTVEVRGAENIPGSGFLVASKHQSLLDILVLLPLLPRFVFVLKRELTWIPVFGQMLVRAQMIPIDRSAGRSVLGRLNARVDAAVRQGLQPIIFPEGTRRPPGAEPAYKSGVSHLYVATGAPCLPVALNSGLFWPRRSFLRYPGRVVVDILPAIAPGLPKETFQPLLQDRIESASNRLLSRA